MWTTKRRATGAEALLDRLRTRAWKTEAERDETLKAIAAAQDLDADDIAWLAVDPDVALRQAGLSFLKRYPYEATSAAIFPFLASRTEAVRRQDGHDDQQLDEREAAVAPDGLQMEHRERT